MNTSLKNRPLWITSTFGDQSHSSQHEVSALERHLNSCKGSRGRWFALHIAAETMNGFMAPRFVTTLVLVGTLFIGLASLAS